MGYRFCLKKVKGHSNCEGNIIADKLAVAEVTRIKDTRSILLADEINTNTATAVIIELKQWAKVEKVHNDCKHSIMSDLKSHEPVAHPSYQAYSYKCLLLNYCDDKVIKEEFI